MEYDILQKYVEEINTRYKCGCWADWISAKDLAQLMNISTYKVRKAFKKLAEEGYLELGKVPTAFQDYDNGLCVVSEPWLYCKAYVLTPKAFEKYKN